LVSMSLFFRGKSMTRKVDRDLKSLFLIDFEFLG
jgi:hypothetical protein